MTKKRPEGGAESGDRDSKHGWRNDRGGRQEPVPREGGDARSGIPLSRAEGRKPTGADAGQAKQPGQSKPPGAPNPSAQANPHSQPAPGRPVDQEPQAAAASAGDETPKQRSGFIWRWTKRLAVVGLILAVLFRISLQFWLPSAVNAAVEGAGMTCEWEDFDLSLLGLDVELRHVDLRDAARPDAAPLTHVEYARLDLDVSALVTFGLRVHRVEADGVDIELLRDKNGQWVLPEPKDPAPAEGEVPAEPEVAADSATEESPHWKLSSPVQLDALRLQQVRIHVVDALHSIDARFGAEARISDIGHPTRPALIALQLLAPGYVDAAVIEAKVQSSDFVLNCDYDVELRTIRPGALRGWLEAAGLQPVAHALDAELGGSVALTSSSEREQLTAAFALDGLGFRADGEPAIQIEGIGIDVTYDPTRLEVEQVKIDGIDVAVQRGPSGVLRAMGFDLVAAEPAAEAPSEPAAVEAPAPTDAKPMAFGVRVVDINEVRLAVDDQASWPPTELGVAVRSLHAEDIGEGRPTRFRGVMALAGVAESIELTGALRPGSDQGFGFEVGLSSGAIDMTGLDPWLRPAGIAGLESACKFELGVDGQVAVLPGGGQRIRATVATLELGADEPLVRLGPLDIEIESKPEELRVQRAEIAGLRLPVTRDQDGRFSFAGLQTLFAEQVEDLARAANARASAAIAAASAARPAPVLAAAQPVATNPDAVSPEKPDTAGPGAEGAEAEAKGAPTFIDRLAITDSNVTLIDAATATVRELPIELTATISDLVLGDEIANEAGVDLNLGSDVFGRVSVRGTINSQPGLLDLRTRLAIAGQELDVTSLKPFLDGSGVVPVLTGGILAAEIDASVKQDAAGATTLRASIEGLALRDADGEMIAVDTLRLDETVLAPDATRVGKLLIEGVRADVRRAANGELFAGGVKIVPPPEGEAAAAAEAPAAPPPSQSTADGAGAPAEPAAAPAALSLAGVSLKGVALRWRDRLKPTQPVDTTLSASVEVGPVSGIEPLRFELQLGLSGLLEELKLGGEVTPDPVKPRAALQLAGKGLRGDAQSWVSAYLPPGQSLEIAAGTIAATINAQVDPHPEGGQVVALAVEDFAIRDGDTVLAGLEALRVNAPRIDPEGGRVIAVEELALTGLRAELWNEDGVLHAFGLRMDPSAAPPVEAAPAAEPAAVDAGAGPAPSDPVPPPTITLGTLNLGVASVSYREGDGPPIELDLSFRNVEPVTLIAPDPEELAPWNFELRVGAGPDIGRVALDLQASPWSFDPEAKLDLNVSELRGAPLHEYLPSLDESLDLRGIDGGSLVAALEARLLLRRRDPTEFDLSRGFGLETELKGLAFRAVPDGPVLAGIDSIFLDAPRLGGPSGAIRVSELAISDIKAEIRQDAEGMHLLGMTLLPAAEGEATDPAAEDQPEEKAAEEMAAAADEQPADGQPAEGDAAETAIAEAAEPAPAPPVRIDRFVMQGLDFVFRDDTVDPPFVAPLNQLSVSLDGFRMGGEGAPPPARLEVSLGAGAVEMPARNKASSMLAGFVSSIGSAVTGGADEAELVERKMLSELLIQGRFVPDAKAPSGKITVEMVDLELLSLRGLASAGGVNIGDGVMNMRIGTELDKGALGIDTNIGFTDLSLDEPPDGPISAYLKLPAPLDSVLFVLKDEDDEISIPLGVDIGADGSLSMGQIAGAAGSALLSIITDAIAASPFRVAGAATGLLGFGGEEELPAEANVLLEYQAGAVDPPIDTRQRIAALVGVLGDEEYGVVLQPFLGRDDLARAEVLASPEQVDRRALVERLRLRKRELWRDRDATATELAVIRKLGGSALTKEQVRQRLRAIDTEVGNTEEALDRVLALLRPGAERSRDRRARRLAMEFVEARADALRELIAAAGVTDAEARIQVRRPRLPDSDEMKRGIITLKPRKRSQ